MWASKCTSSSNSTHIHTVKIEPVVIYSSIETYLPHMYDDEANKNYDRIWLDCFSNHLRRKKSTIFTKFFFLFYLTYKRADFLNRAYQRYVVSHNLYARFFLVEKRHNLDRIQNRYEGYQLQKMCVRSTDEHATLWCAYVRLSSEYKLNMKSFSCFFFS